MGKSCICIALVLILVTTIGLAPLAQPAEAVAGVVVAGAVVAVMAMAGITIVTSGMTAAQIQDWVEAKLEEWATDVGSPVDHLINSAGIGVTISGLLTIGTAAAQGISDFISWLKTDTGLSDNDSYNAITGGAFFGEIPVLMTNSVTVNTTSYTNLIISTNIECGFVLSTEDSNTKTICIVNYLPFSYSISSPFNSTQQAMQVRDGYYVGTVGSNRYNQIYSIVPNIPTANFNVYNYVLNNNFGTFTSSGSLSLDTGVIAIPQVQNDDKVFVDVGALPGSTVSEVTDGVFTDVAAENLDVSGTVAEEEPEYVITGPVSVSGLDDIFPFCIPFDLYHMLEALAADPVAPYFEWRFYVPRIIDYTIVIDLSGFNTVAQILRIMETLLFCVGLAFETRKLIRS